MVLPPEAEPTADGVKPGGWWHALDDQKKLVCDLCPRACALKPDGPEQPGTQMSVAELEVYE